MVRFIIVIGLFLHDVIKCFVCDPDGGDVVLYLYFLRDEFFKSSKVMVTPIVDTASHVRYVAY